MSDSGLSAHILEIIFSISSSDCGGKKSRHLSDVFIYVSQWLT